MQSTYLQKKNKLKSTVQSASKEAKNETPALPNSLLLAMHGGNSEDAGNPELENIMKSRLAAFHRQIPVAENEADKLSSGITSGTPEQVKQSMGERLGTDFSSVRFHTGESISQKADNIGARAWTQGNDVYFGEGGFHPAVAAHELVHTAQQGAVDSSAVNVSAPMGGVQMLPGWLCGCGSSAQQTNSRPKQRKYHREDLQKICEKMDEVEEYKQEESPVHEKEPDNHEKFSHMGDMDDVEANKKKENKKKSWHWYNPGSWFTKKLKEESAVHKKEPTKFLLKMRQISKLKRLDESNMPIDSSRIAHNYKSTDSENAVDLHREFCVAFATPRKFEDFEGNAKSLQKSIVNPLANLLKNTKNHQRATNMNSKDQAPVKLLVNVIRDNIKALESGKLEYDFKGNGIDEELKDIFISGKIESNVNALIDIWQAFPDMFDEEKDKELIEHYNELLAKHGAGQTQAEHYINRDIYAQQYNPKYPQEKIEGAGEAIAIIKRMGNVQFKGPAKKKKH